MKLRLLVPPLALAAALAAQSVHAATPARPQLTEAPARFPDRSYVLTLPSGTRVGPGNVQVVEDGQVVPDLTVVAATEGRPKEFGVVLAIDASRSMRGKPIEGALAAAREFAAHRTAEQRLAILTFNNSTQVLQPFTTDGLEIEQALEQPVKLAYGTNAFDAVAAGVELLQRAKVSAGSVVVLSDGADIGSRLSEAEVAALARKAHVRVFTVGLRSRFFEKGPLATLARGTAGRYSEANSPAQLRSIYGELGTALANEYLIRYRSTAGPGKKVTVTVSLGGVEARPTTAYVTPKLPVEERAVAQPYRRPFANRLWSSTVTMVLVALMTATLVSFAVIAMVSGPRRGTVRRRLAEFISVPEPVEEKRPTALLTERVLEGTDRFFGRTRWWSRFKWELDLAQVSMPAEQLVVLTFAATFLAIWLLQLSTGSTLGAMLGLGIPFFVRAWTKRRVVRIRQRFGEQLPDNLQVLASALRAGHSFVGALSVVVEDAPEPSRAEFRRVVSDEQLGVPLEDAMNVVVERMESQELGQVALVAALQRETGGNTAEVLDRVTETIRERTELRRLVRTLTAQGRLSRWIVSLLPVVLFLLIALINPRYLRPLYTHTAGQIMLAFGVLLIIGGSLVIKRIVDIKV